MDFITGFLGLLCAARAGPTELTAAGYRRQPICFSLPRFGLATNSVAYDFGPVADAPPVVARAVFDRPAGANLAVRRGLLQG